MYFYVKHPYGLLKNSRLLALFAGVIICTYLSMPCIGLSIDPNGGINLHCETSLVEGSNPANDNSGPTVLLSYSKETFKENPISSFAYFIPLISPTAVDRVTSTYNTQQVGIITYERKITSKSFSVICEFEILGTGFHKNTFEPAGMMALFIDELKGGETLTNMLDYIQFEGEGRGRIEARGKVDGTTQVVTEVNMQFNAKGRKSPVTIGLYDVKPQDGQYKYENRFNQSVARVNSLVFKKSQEDPRMGIKVASISKSTDSEGFWAGIKGAIANLLIRPPKVDKLGNDTMLEFGHALLKQKPEFSFPKAKNIRANRIATMDPAKN
jgi:hypothetical protein